ncbi:hypothetical protein RND81_01G224600 [Saponaria officinalis]|uniref:Cytochrome P450 n=1 Tax=Saponaria officinalis TaxID=3572 RepID=A0AAW1N959_SAPOF
MLYFALLTLLTILISHFLLKKLLKNAPYNPPPGPKGLPLIGNLHQLDFVALYVQLAKLAKSYGPIISLRLGLTRVIVVQSASTAKEVLKTQDLNFCSKAPRVGLLKLSYNGLEMAFGPYSECFREVKKLSILNLLSPKRVQMVGNIRQDEVSRIAFGKRYEEEEGTKSKFHELLNEAQASLTTFYFADYFPSAGWLDKITGISGRLNNIFKRLDSFYQEIIDDHLDPVKRRSRDEDFVDVLLRLREENTLPFEYTLDHIKALLMNVFVAGTDTSAIMLVWAMTELIKNPGAMKRVQQELRNGTKNNGFTVDDDFSKFEYFMGVIKETLRMHPAAPLLIARDTIQKCSIQGYDILPKTVVFVNVWAIARDPEYWKEPEKFMPERFIGNSVSYRGQDFEFIPFGAGRRICPGLHLGSANMILTLANLLYHFNWKMPAGLKSDDIDTEAAPGLAKHKKNPLCLVAKKFVP